MSARSDDEWASIRCRTRSQVTVVDVCTFTVIRNVRLCCISRRPRRIVVSCIRYVSSRRLQSRARPSSCASCFSDARVVLVCEIDRSADDCWRDSKRLVKEGLIYFERTWVHASEIVLVFSELNCDLNQHQPTQQDIEFIPYLPLLNEYIAFRDGCECCTTEQS